MRTFADPSDHDDLAVAHGLQDQVATHQADAGVFDVPVWDHDEVEQMRNMVGMVGSLATDSSKMFGRKEDLDPAYWTLGAAVGWGGLPATAATYGITFPDRNDGETPHRRSPNLRTSLRPSPASSMDHPRASS